MRRTTPGKGVYALLVRVPTKLVIEVGKLGKRELAAGVYVYIGSALNSLPGRISRHLIGPRKRHWHIDYLLDERNIQALGVAWKRTSRRVECSLSRNMRRKTSQVVKGFGCSDCSCSSHLYYFPRFQEAIKAVSEAGLPYLLEPRLPYENQFPLRSSI